jgi:hypothetical protein
VGSVRSWTYVFDQVVFMRVRANHWAPMATSFEEGHMEVEQRPNMSGQCIECPVKG